MLRSGSALVKRDNHAKNNRGGSTHANFSLFRGCILDYRVYIMPSGWRNFSLCGYKSSSPRDEFK